jgi:hypothetical protein
MDRKRSQTDRPFIHSMQVQLICSELHPFWHPLERKSFLLNLPFFPELKNCCMCFTSCKDLQITDLKKASWRSCGL